MQEMKAAEALKFATAEGVVMFGGRKTGRKAPLRKPYAVKVEIGARGVVTVTNVETGKTDTMRTGTLFYAAPVEQQEAADTIADVRKGDVIRYEGDSNAYRITAKRRHLGGLEASCERVNAETGRKVPARISRPDERVEILRSASAADVEETRAVESADRFIERETPRVAELLRADETADDDDEPTAQDIADAALGACEWSPEQSAADAAADRAERADLEKARARAERLRNRDDFLVSVEEVPVPANFRELAKEGNTPQARAYWSRRIENYTLVETIKAHARANYDLGYDRVVEGYTDGEILAFCQEQNVDTPAEAIEALDLYAAAWADSECGALVDGYGV